VLKDIFQQKPYIIAGPCSAESEEQMITIGEAFKDSPVQMIRAGIWKPRTKPGSFEGMGAAALPWLQLAKKMSGKPVCIEVANPEQVELALKYDIDCLWIGARSTVSPFIVQEIADSLKGVSMKILIKNPVNPDIDLWQGAIERFQQAGITELGAIHRGFSSYDKASKYRNKPNWAIPIELRRRMPDLPLFCDPSHITGRRDMIAFVSQRALDLHFDGLMIETHPTPDLALSDAAQQVTPNTLKEILNGLILRKEIVATSGAQEKLDDLRQMIDSLDAEVVDLIARRMQIVENIAAVKGEHNISVYQPERWREIIEHRTHQGGQLNLNTELLKKLFEVIHDMSIKTQLSLMK
jgi:chorismate mutase